MSDHSRAPLLVTGFGPFVDVEQNPSGAIVQRLAAEPPDGIELCCEVLPVTIDGSAARLDEVLAGLEASGAEPAGILCLGVQKEPTFRLERRARGVLSSEKLDNDGRRAAGIVLPGPDELWTEASLEDLASALEEAGAPAVTLSEDAGGFVCERVYHQALRRAQARGRLAQFLHVPPESALDVERQTAIVRGALRTFYDQCNQKRKTDG